MIDTHCHLTFPRLIERAPDVIDGAARAGVGRMITVGTTPGDARACQVIAEADERVWFTSGIHPHYINDVDESAIGELVALAADERCVAFGEMGVDYHYDDPPRADQHRMFAAQLEAVKASGMDKPIVIHCRKAVDDTLAIIRESRIAGERFVFHCHTESPEECRKVLDLGAMISFTGIVTYKNAPEVRASAELVPMERMMVETDAPFLAPEPHRKVRPNEPKYVMATARFLAELKGLSLGEFERVTDGNAERFFGLSSVG